VLASLGERGRPFPARERKKIGKFNSNGKMYKVTNTLTSAYGTDPMDFRAKQGPVRKSSEL
jgi:hypothetical protein